MSGVTTGSVRGRIARTDRARVQGRIAKATAAALALTALSGLADGAAAAAGGGGWTLRATPGASVDRPRDGASPWVFTTGPTHQLAQIARRLPSSGSTVVVARVERIAVRRALRPRAIVTIGAPGRPQVQVGVAARKGALRWAVWSGSGRPHVLSVRAGRPATLAVAAGPRGASVAVGGRTVFRSRAPFVRGVDRGRVALGPGPGKSAARVALSALRVRKGTLGAPGRITPRSRTAPASSPKSAPSPILLGAEDRPYDPGFAFNQPIPAGVASDARSAAIVGQLDENTEVSKAMMSASGEVPTVYVAKPTDPFYSVSVGGVSTRFRVPAGTVIGTGSDSPLVILDPSHPDHGRHTELRLWQARISGSTLSASGSGLFHYNNDGALLNPSGSRSLSVPFRGAGTGSGMSIMAGLIRPAGHPGGSHHPCPALRLLGAGLHQPLPGAGGEDRSAEQHHHPQQRHRHGHGDAPAARPGGGLLGPDGAGQGEQLA